MTSNRPYLIRAIYEWVVDNDMTPMIAVRGGGGADAEAALEEEFTVYNVSPQAVRDLMIDDEGIRFRARFQGASRHVILDPRDVVRVYCRENDEGLIFPWGGDEDPSDPQEKDPQPEKGRAHLRVVK